MANDRGTGSLFGTIVEEKGPKCAYAVSSFLAWLREQGHARFVLQRDGKPALVAFVNEVHSRLMKESASTNVSCRVSPVGSHEPNGGA